MIRKQKKNKEIEKEKDCRKGIENEARLYSDAQIRAKLKEVQKKVQRGERFPEKWREDLISPLQEGRCWKNREQMNNPSERDIQDICGNLNK